MVQSDSGIFWSTVELREFAGEVVGLNRQYGKGEKGLKGWLPPPMASLNWTREGAAPPSLSFSLSLLSFFPTPKRKGNPTRTWESS